MDFPHTSNSQYHADNYGADVQHEWFPGGWLAHSSKTHPCFDPNKVTSDSGSATHCPDGRCTGDAGLVGHSATLDGRNDVRSMHVIQHQSLGYFPVHICLCGTCVLIPALQSLLASPPHSHPFIRTCSSPASRSPLTISGRSTWGASRRRGTSCFSSGERGLCEYTGAAGYLGGSWGGHAFGAGLLSGCGMYAAAIG